MLYAANPRRKSESQYISPQRLPRAREYVTEHEAQIISMSSIVFGYMGDGCLMSTKLAVNFKFGISETVKLQLAIQLAFHKILTVAEVTIFLDELTPTGKKKRLRADLGVIRKKKLILLIEAKEYDEQLRGVKQKRKYQNCGIPSLHVGKNSVKQVAESIVKYMNGDVSAIGPHLIK